MANAKWLLNTHEEYSKNLILLRLLHLIEAEAVHSDGPFILYREAAVKGWDDIVEVGYREGQFYADHYQVKHQYDDFKPKKVSGGKTGGPSETFMGLFSQAENLLRSSQTFEGIVVTPDRLRFCVCIPTDDVDVQTAGQQLSVGDLRTLCDVCTPAAASQIATDKGEELTEGQRVWLKTVAARFDGDFSRATKVIAQMRVDLWPESALNGVLESRSRFLFEKDDLARSALLARVGEAVPQGGLKALNLLAQLSDLGPKPVLNAVAVHAQHGWFWTSHFVGEQTGTASASYESHVGKVWSDTKPALVRIGFRPEEEKFNTKAARAPMLRLMTHARNSPFSVHSKPEWYELARRLTGRTIGCRGRFNVPILKADAYQDIPPTVRPVPERASDDATFASALHAAMDKVVEQRVDHEAGQLVHPDLPNHKATTARAKTVLFEKGAFRLLRVLRAWWEPKHIDARFRLGPQLVDGIVEVVRALSTLLDAFPETKMEACKSSSVEDQSECIAWVGRTPVRALAIEMAAVPNDDGGYEPRNLEDSAEALLGRPGIILVHRMDIQDVAEPTNVTELGHNPMLSSNTPTGVLINMSTLISRSRKGEHEVVSWVEKQFQSQRGTAAKAAFEAARQAWKEQDDAA